MSEELLVSIDLDLLIVDVHQLKRSRLASNRDEMFLALLDKGHGTDFLIVRDLGLFLIRKHIPDNYSFVCSRADQVGGVFSKCQRGDLCSVEVEVSQDTGEKKL